MKPASGNLLLDASHSASSEVSLTLTESDSVRVERIVSLGHSSPPGFWYDQDRPEWVAVLEGGAILAVEGEAAPRHLRPGDWIDIPAHCRHRIEWTDPDRPTVWLAVHYRNDDVSLHEGAAAKLRQS